VCGCALDPRMIGKHTGSKSNKGQPTSTTGYYGPGTRYVRCGQEGREKVHCPKHGTFWVCHVHLMKCTSGKPPEPPYFLQEIPHVYVEMSCPWCENPVH
jgi:hypothetical protein